MLTPVYTLLSLQDSGCHPFSYYFTCFWYLADWCALDLLNNAAPVRLFQLVVVVGRRKDYVTRRNDQLPRRVQVLSAYMISIPQRLVP